MAVAVPRIFKLDVAGALIVVVAVSNGVTANFLVFRVVAGTVLLHGCFFL